ncbi:MAG: hypothetical protein EXR75_14035, partial [Myxococcales bacterium]|nr:hypothetical protein [Myxococcales bacterium]
MVARIAKRAELASAATALVVVVAAAACFYLPALAATGGRWPVPLDDVYIYFGFARSAALGHPFEWLPGNGYSSGATAVLYPLVLAPFWAAGLRGSSLGVAAALVAVSGLVVLARALASLGCRRGAAPYLPALLLVSVPLVNWSWFSGMETGLFALFLGRALVATQAAVDCDKSVRRRAQLRAGIWFALLVITRPEALVLAAALAVAVAHGARSLWTLASLARAAAPAILTLALQFTANHAVTGEWQSAGAVRKLVTEAPFLTAEARAIEVAKNLLVLASEALWRALGGAVGVAAFGTLVLAAMVLRARRRLAVSLAVGSLGALVLVCLNTTARYQNYRYAAPSLAMLLCAAILGFSAISGRISAKFGAPRPASFRAQGRRMSLGNSARTVLAETPARVFPMPLRNSARTGLAVALAAIAIAAPAHELPPQVAHFTRASVNILEQHAEVAHRLARMTPPARRVLVGDAGAIPYLSKLAAIDALGLGGYHALPFA